MIRCALSLAVLVPLAAACVRDAEAFRRPDQPPVRIVAGSVLAAEVLLEIAPRERIAAVHYVAADPSWSLVAAAAGTLRQVGADPEDLLSVAPDLVIVDAFTRPETLAIMAGLGVPVLRTGTPGSFADVADNIRRIGSACHLEPAAETLVAAMAARLAELAERGRDLAGWQLLSLDGALHTYGKGSLFHAVVEAAGAQNLAALRGVGPFRKLDLESLLAWQPEVLVIDMVSDESAERAWLDQITGSDCLPAIAQNRVMLLPSNRFSTTSHRLVETVAFVQDALRRWHPR